MLNAVKFERWLDPRERDVFAVQMDQELLEIVRDFKFMQSSIFVGDYLMFSATGGNLQVVSEDWFKSNFHRADDTTVGMTKAQIIASRTWIVEYEIKDVKGAKMTRFVAPKTKNTPELVTEIWLNERGASRVLNVTKA